VHPHNRGKYGLPLLLPERKWSQKRISLVTGGDAISAWLVKKAVVLKECTAEDEMLELNLTVISFYYLTLTLSLSSITSFVSFVPLQIDFPSTFAYSLYRA
jgi:hypothetical protein